MFSQSGPRIVLRVEWRRRLFIQGVSVKCRIPVPSDEARDQICSFLWPKSIALLRVKTMRVYSLRQNTLLANKWLEFIWGTDNIFAYFSSFLWPKSTVLLRVKSHPLRQNTSLTNKWRVYMGTAHISAYFLFFFPFLTMP